MEDMHGDRVKACRDGQYRWFYNLKAHHNYDIYFYWLRFILPFTVPMALVALVGGRNAKPYFPVLFLGVFMLLLPVVMVLIWRVIASRLGYRLSDTELETWPKGSRNTGPYALKDLRRITCVPEKDLILLRFAIVTARVYVSREDYELVQELLCERAPQGTEFFR